MKKKISIVIPTYRRARLLKKCLEALSIQHFSLNDFEIVVISDGPDASTKKMLNSLVEHPLPFVQYLSLPQHQGPAAARNAGWQFSKGELIAFTDDDCLPAPNWLTSLWHAFDSLNQPEYVAFSRKTTVPLPEEPSDYDINTSFLENGDFITANCACTRAALEATGGFDEQFEAAWREDSDLEFKLIQKGIPIHRINDAEVVHPVRKAQWGISIKEQKKTMFNALLYKKFPALYKKKIQRSPAWNYYLIIGGFTLMIIGLASDNKILFYSGMPLYLILTTIFIAKRLRRTSKSFRHLSEMVITSLAIPFLSVYWTLYGAFKYRVLFY